MKIVDRDTFLALPDWILASKWEPCYLEHAFIKTATLPAADTESDFLAFELTESQATCDTAKQCGEAPLEMDPLPVRDGDLEGEQQFAIWSGEDVQSLIDTLKAAIPAATAATESLTMTGLSKTGMVVNRILRTRG